MIGIVDNRLRYTVLVLARNEELRVLVVVVPSGGIARVGNYSRHATTRPLSLRIRASSLSSRLGKELLWRKWHTTRETKSPRQRQHDERSAGGHDDCCAPCKENKRVKNAG